MNGDRFNSARKKERSIGVCLNLDMNRIGIFTVAVQEWDSNLSERELGPGLRHWKEKGSLQTITYSTGQANQPTHQECFTEIQKKKKKNKIGLENSMIVQRSKRRKSISGTPFFFPSKIETASSFILYAFANTEDQTIYHTRDCSALGSMNSFMPKKKKWWWSDKTLRRIQWNLWKI